jgi:high-affinity iron transporter
VRDPAAAARGAELYKATCAACHGGQGAGDGPFAEILQDLRGERIRPRNFLEDPMRLGERPEDLYRALTLGFEGTPMPGFAGLYDEASRLDLVAFLLALRDSGARLR